MLKPLLITTATLFSATLVSLTTTQVANAATQSNSVQSGHQELIARSNKSSNLSTRKQADLKSIHEVLTTAYRGMNNHNVEEVQSTELKPPAGEKIYLQRLFKRLKAMRIDASFEVKSIELVQLTGHTAIVKVGQLTTVNGRGKTGNVLQETTVALVKYQGKWKVSDSDAIIKSISKDR
jgi:hypothetical protein